MHRRAKLVGNIAEGKPEGRASVCETQRKWMKIEFSIEKGRSIREDMFHQLGESCSFITTTDIFKKKLCAAVTNIHKCV